ncbi:MAG TPA: hypothetical protein PL122_07400, partial [Bacteroidales bacterium]|nr:hypothetical protein [Bacteroidales bacterium]
ENFLHHILNLLYNMNVTLDFVNFHRFTTRRAFGIREREVFAFVRMGKFERMIADFAKELLVTVFVMTVFVQAGGTAFRTREC